jgi:GNAT superfamily N-acetyltransferase
VSLVAPSSSDGGWARQRRLRAAAVMMPSSLRIRRSSAPPSWQTFRRCSPCGPGLEASTPPPPIASTTCADVDDVRRLILEAPGALLVAADERGLVGALVAAWDGWRGNMYRLAVSPEHRREGVARRLVASGEHRLRQLGARRVTALVAHDDSVAAAFWNAAGYPVDAEIGRRVRNL